MINWIKTRSLPQLAGTGMIIAGLMAFVYQCAKNGATASKFSASTTDKIIDFMGGMSVEVFVMCAAIGLFAASKRGVVHGKFFMTALIGLCVAFGMIAAGQQISVSRTQKTAEVGVNQSVHASRAQQLASAQSELAALKQVRPVSTVEALIAQEKAKGYFSTTQGCTDVGRFANSCRIYNSLRSELGTAQRRVDLETRIAGLTTAIGTTTGAQIATADPIAVKLAQWTDMSVEDAQITMAFVQAFTMMLLAMFGIHFGLLVYGLDDAPRGVVAAPAVPANVTPFQAAAFANIHHPGPPAIGGLNAYGRTSHAIAA